MSNRLDQLRLAVLRKAFQRAQNPDDDYSFDNLIELRHQLAKHAKVLKVPDEHQNILKVVAMIEGNSGQPMNFRQRESQGMAAQMLATAPPPKFFN